MKWMNALKLVALSLLGALAIAGCGSSNDLSTSTNTSAAAYTCSTGYVYSSTYGCLPQSTCSSGYALYNNQCIYVGTTTSTSYCPTGTYLYNNQCISSTTTTTTTNSCQGTCSAGYVMTAYGCLPQSGCSSCFGNYGRYCIGVYGSNLWYQAY